jgi:gliding motility-associated-like protein
MKKIFLFLLSLVYFGTVNSQTQIVIGGQSSTFTSWVRGYHFTSPVSFVLCGLYIPTDASTGAQSVSVVRFSAAPPPAFPATTNAFTTLFTQQNYVPNTIIPCNITINAGDIIGVYGARANTCINSYDGTNYVATILGMPATLSRSGMQQCLFGTPMANIWSEVNFSIGRIFMYYNCCTTPTITANANPTSVCPTTSVALLGGGASTYTWTPGSVVGTSISVTPTVSTTFTVTGTSTAGCIATQTVAVTVNPTPTITAASNPTAICVGNTATLTGGGGTSYTWAPGMTVGNSVTVSPAATTVFTVTGQNALGCRNTRTVSLTVNPLPPVVPGSNSPVCTGGTLNLSVGAATSYTWTGPGGFTSSAQNPNVNNVTATNAGVYTVTIANALGCKNTNTVNVVVNPLPVINPANTGPYCVGNPISLSTSAAMSYSWTGPGAFTSNFQNPSIAVGQTTNSGIYSLTVTSAGGCLSTGTTSVTVNPVPTPTAGSNSPVCVGSPLNLSGSAASSYTWSGPGPFNASVQNPSAPAIAGYNGQFTLTVANAFGCTTSTVTNVVINPLPVIAVNNPTVCANQNIAFTSNGGVSYSWTGPLGFSSALQNPVIANATTGMSGAYTVLVTDANTCTNTAVANVTVLTLPVAVIGSNSPLCVGANLNLTGNGGATYIWNGPNGFSSFAQNPTISNVTVPASGIYTLIASAGTCSASTTASITVNALPTPTAGSNNPVCVGSSINFTGSSASTYTWSGPNSFASSSQNPNIGVAALVNGGIYTFSVTDVNGCVNGTTTMLTINSLPVIGVTHPTVCVNQTINLSSNGGVSYSWTGPLGFTSPAQNPTIANATTGMSGAYTVLVTDANTCTNTAVANVTVLTLPTPNIISNSPVCAGGNLNLNGSGGSTYAWSGPNGFSSATQNPTISNVTVPATGMYTLVASAGTCSASTTASVTINALPTPTAGSNSPVCVGSPITFSGSSAVSYTWSGPASFASNLQNPNIGAAAVSNGGAYTFSVTDVNGCVNGTTTNLTINTLPVIAVNNPTVCVNQTINLTSNGGVSYSWNGPAGFASGVQNPNIANSTLAMSGAYTVLVTDANTCTNTAIANVSVLTLPVPLINSNSPVCFGSTLTLSGSGGAAYAWAGPNGFFSLVQNPSITNVTLPANGIYTLVASAGNCTASTTSSITINALPTPTAQSNSPVCVNQPINFTGSGATSYTWTGPASFNTTVQNPSVGSATLANAGQYTLTVTDVNGCRNFTTVNVTVNTLPVIAVNNPTVCVNQTMNLTSNGGVAYAWTGPAGFSSAVQNPSIPNATSPMSGPYFVTVTSAQGCTNTATSNATVYPLPTPNIVSNSPVCVGGTLNLMGNGGASYSWTGPGFSNATQNPTITNVTLANNGVYTLLVSSGNCTASATATITINALPVPNIISNSPVCINNPINFTGSGGTNYVWTGPLGFSSSNQNPNIPASVIANSGIYTLTVVDANNCLNSITSNVTVNPQPTVTATGTTVCENGTTMLMSNGGVQYSWSGPNNFTSNSQNPFITNASPLGAGQYTVVATNANSCTNTAIANLMVTPAPTPTIASNSPVCVNEQLSLSAGGGVSYAWTGPNGFFSNLQSPMINASSTAYSGNYAVTVTDANGCFASTNITTTVNALPVASISSSANKGCAPLCVTFTVQSNPPSTGAGWNLGNGAFSNGVNNTMSCYNASGIFSVTANVVDVNGCTNIAYSNVEVHPQPVADFNYSPLKPVINIDNEVTFTNASYGTNISNYNWYFMSTAQYQSIEQNPHFFYTEPGNYAVTLVVKSDQGCTDTIVKAVTVAEDFGVYVPNAFTPNGDGLNDVFQPKGFGVVKYEMQIFDRWGEKVFETNEFEKGWDGTTRNKLSKDEVYTWRIKLTSVFGKAHEMTGHVTLMK